MKRPVLRLAVQITVALLLVTATVLVLGPVRSELDRRFGLIKADAVSRIEQLLGRAITYDSISPSILRYLSISNLTIHGNANEPADLLTVGRMRLYYRPFKLLSGNFSEAFTELRIENTTLTLDTRVDTDVTALVADVLGQRSAPAAQSEGGGTGGAAGEPGAAEPAALADILPQDFVFSGRNIDLSVHAGIGAIEMHRLFFSASLAADVVRLRFQGDASLNDTSEKFPLRSVTGRIDADGTVNVSSGNTLLQVSLEQVTSDIATVDNQVLQVRYSKGVLEARNVQNRDPIDIYARYIDANGELYARVLADGYRLSDLVTLEGPYASFNRYLAFPFRGQANATVTPDSLSFGGSLLTNLSDIPNVPNGELTIQFDGTRDAITIGELTYVTPVGTAEFGGRVGLDPLRPSGTLTVRDLTYGGISPLNVTASLRSVGNEISVTTGRFAYGGSTIRSLEGQVTLGATPNARVTVELGPGTDSRLEITSELGSYGSVSSARIDARQVDPERLVAIQKAIAPGVQVPDISFLPNGTVVDTRVDLDLTTGVSVNVPLFYAFDSGNPDDYLSFALSYQDGAIDLRDVDASYLGYGGKGSFTATIRKNGSVDFTSDVVVEQIPYRFSGTLEPDNSLVISGMYDVDARLYFGERGEIVFRGSGDIPLPIAKRGDEQPSLGFSGNGYFFSPQDWALTVDEATAHAVPYGPVSAADVAVTGSLSPKGARFSSVSYSDAYSELSGTAELTWDLQARTGTATLVLGGDPSVGDGNETYDVTAQFDGSQIDANARITELPLLRLGVESIRGALSGTASLTGPLDALSLVTDAELVDGKFNNDPVDLAARVQVTPDGASISNADGRWVRSRVTGFGASLSFGDGTLDASGSLTLPGRDGNVTVGLTAGGTFTTLSSFDDLLTSDFAGALTLSDLPVKQDLPGTWVFDVNRSDGHTSASGGPGRAVAATLDPDGSFTANIGSPLPLHFDSVGYLQAGQIEADLTNVRADVARLWAILPPGSFALTGGIGTGSLRLVGPVNDPDFYGTLVADGVTASLDMIPDTLGPVRTYVVFDEKVFTVREAVVPAGSGAARVSMEAVLDRWLPEQYQVHVRTTEGGSVRVAHDFGGVRMSGLADGTLTVSGARTSTDITGDITASNMDITLANRGDRTETGADTSDTSVEVTVHTGRSVQFHWPTDTIPILRGTAAVGEVVNITYESAASSYAVKGDVAIQGGEVFYFDRSFYIREGRIAFDENEQKFDPMLTVNAEIREVADEGPVRIYLVADERPLSEFTPQWRSDPPMSEASILALLGGNVFVGESGSPINISEAALLGSNLVSQFGLINGFESSVRDALQLDLFSIRTQLFQNLLRGVIDQNPQYALDTGSPSLGQYLDNTTLFMGKYLGTDLFLELMVQMRAAQNGTPSAQSLAGIEVESELNLEWQTPFFLLNWKFFPSDPSSLFLADNTVSFSWEYSY